MQHSHFIQSSQKISRIHPLLRTWFLWAWLMFMFCTSPYTGTLYIFTAIPCHSHTCYLHFESQQRVNLFINTVMRNASHLALCLHKKQPKQQTQVISSLSNSWLNISASWQSECRCKSFTLMNQKHQGLLSNFLLLAIVWCIHAFHGKERHLTIHLLNTFTKKNKQSAELHTHTYIKVA